MLLDKASLAVRLAVERDPERYPLQSVLVDGARTVATDGHILAMVAHAPDPVDDFPQLPFAPEPVDAPVDVVVPVEMLDLAADALPTVKGDTAAARASLTVEGGEVAITIGCGAGSNVTRDRAPDRATWPSYKKVAPRGEPSLRLTFDAALLLKLAKIGKACVEGGSAGPQLPVTLEIHGPDKGFIVRVDRAPRFVGVQMPMRAADKAEFVAEAEAAPEPEPVGAAE